MDLMSAEERNEQVKMYKEQRQYMEENILDRAASCLVIQTGVWRFTRNEFLRCSVSFIPYYVRLIGAFHFAVCLAFFLWALINHFILSKKIEKVHHRSSPWLKKNIRSIVFVLIVSLACGSSIMVNFEVYFSMIEPACPAPSPSPE